MTSLVNLRGLDVRVRGRVLRVARLEREKYQEVTHPEETLDALRKCGTRIDLFTFLQRLPETSPKHAYPMEWDNVAALPISTFEQWWTGQIDNKTRNMVRKSERKGVITREVRFDNNLVEGIWKIYNECPVRQAGRFTHYGEDLETVHREEATFLDQSIFIGAFFEDRMVGFIKLVCDDAGKEAHVLNIVSMIGHRDKAPTNALVAQAVRSCAERGISWLVYSKFAYGKKLQSSLSDFKKNNGFRQIDLPRYYVPLTRTGRLAYRLRLHQPLAYRLPGPLTAKARELRRAWYGRKLRDLEVS